MQYHNLTNQMEYDNKGSVNKQKTEKLRQKAQEIFDGVFDIDRKAIEAITLEEQKRQFEKVKGISQKDFIKMLSENK